MKRKKCTKCGKYKPRNAFYQWPARGWIAGMCKVCKKQYMLKYRKEHAKELAVKAKAHNKTYFADPVNRARNLAGAHRRYMEQRMPRLAKVQKYYQEHRAEKIAYAVRYVARRKLTDPAYKIKHNLGCRLNVLLRKIGERKRCSTMSLVGCTATELKLYLEGLFQLGMTWANYGKKQGTWGWDIDHIIPCIAFDMTDTKQQKDCFHWTNLQPLWHPDNLRKHARMSELSRPVK